MPTFGFGMGTALQQPPQPVNTKPLGPGEDLEVSGLAEFIRTSNRFRDVTGSITRTANQAGLSQAIGRAGEQADTSFDVAEGALARRQRALGLNLSDRQKRAQARRLGLGRALAKAGATSGVRRDFAETARAAQTAAGGIEDSLRSIESEGLKSLSNSAGQEEIRREEKKSAKKQAKDSLIGNIIGGALAFISDETLKHDKVAIEGSLLDRLKDVRVEKWKYVGEDTDHVGPYAQEFNDTFGVGKDDPKKISIIDAVGVAMGAIKELNQKVERRA